MRNFFLLLAGLIDLLASYPYIRDSLKGKTKPNVASWSTWTLVNGIMAASALAAGGAFNTVVLGTSFFVGSLTILLIAIFRGTRKYTLFDGVCQAAAIVGIILWQLSNNPNIALMFVIIVDIFAISPTIRHAFRFPHEETWTTFFIAGLMSVVVTVCATSISFAALAVPVESVFVNILLAGTIYFRRNSLKPETS